MKILQIMASCSKGSGVANVVMRYFRQIHQEVTFDFLVFGDNESTFSEDIRSLGGEVYVVPFPGMCKFSQYVKSVDEFFASHAGEYDAVHLHEVYLNVLFFSIAKKYGISVRIAHAHNTQFSDRFLNSIRNGIAVFPVRWFATHFIGCSIEAGEAFFGKRICESELFSFVKNAIETKSFAFSERERERLRKELGIQDQFVIGHVGRFAPQKNHAFLLEIFYEFCKNNDGKLLLIGGGPLQDVIAKKAEALGVNDRIIYTGERTDVASLLSAMDAFVLPSFFEGLPCVLIEAQSNGLPCFVADTISRNSDILPSYRILSLKDSAAKWADAISQFGKTRDNSALMRMDAAGYDILGAACNLVSLYNKLINK